MSRRPAKDALFGAIAGKAVEGAGPFATGGDQAGAGERLHAYCRGPCCVYADDAVRQVTGTGYRARRLEDGFPERQRAGLPVAAGERG